MPLFSVGDVLPLIGRKLGGTGVDPSCEPGKSQAIEMMNKINRLLFLEQETIMKSYAYIPINRGCITLDRRIKRILMARDKCGSINTYDRSAMFMDELEWDQLGGSDCSKSLVFLGARFPTYMDLDKPRVLFAVSDRPEQEDLVITVTGRDQDGNVLRTHGAGVGRAIPVKYMDCQEQPQYDDGDGMYRGYVSSIEMVRKPRTNGYVQLWGYDEHDGSVFWITTMAPDEQSPSLTRYRVNGISGGVIAAEVSLQYVPLYDENEVALIQVPDAYEQMAQAISLMDNGNYGGYQAYRNSALSLIRKNRAQETGNTKHMHIPVMSLPARGRTWSFRRRC